MTTGTVLLVTTSYDPAPSQYKLCAGGMTLRHAGFMVLEQLPERKLRLSGKGIGAAARRSCPPWFFGLLGDGYGV